MYLSELVFDIRNPAVRDELGNRYELHRTLARGVDPRYEHERMLWRLEVHPEMPRVLVQTLYPPCWDDPLVRMKLYGEPIVHRLDFAGNPLKHFTVECNPTRVRTLGNGRKRREAITEPDEIEQWLRRQCNSVLGMTLVACAQHRGYWVRLPKGNSAITLYVVRCEGRARVHDADMLYKGAGQGIGRGKAFGLGLVSLSV